VRQEQGDMQFRQLRQLEASVKKEMTIPETGVKILLINSDSGSDAVKVIAPAVVGALVK